MERTEKMKEQVYGFLAVTAFVVGIFGSTGGVDAGMITIWRGLVQIVVSAALAVIFGRLANARMKEGRENRGH